MKIRFEKIDEDRHRLTVDHDSAVCETKSLLLHDFLHYAVEKESKLAKGFWGELSTGKSFAEMKGYKTDDLKIVEMVVGALHPAAKQRSTRELITGLVRFLDVAGEQAPCWVDEAMIDAAKERMRKMVGEWKATGALSLEWP